MKVSTSVLNYKKSDFESLFNSLIEFKSDFIHIDIMEKDYINNIGFDYTRIIDLKNKEKFNFDVHLMVKDPNDYFEVIKKLNVKRVSFGIESKCFILNTISKFKLLGIEVGLVVDLNTDIQEVFSFLKKVDFVIVMGVKAGLGGQEFNNSCLAKIVKLNDYKNTENLDFDICVDGGISCENLFLFSNIGVDCIISGSFILKNHNICDTIKKIKKG